MPYVLTAAGSGGCAHQGKTKLPGSAKLTVAGQPVVVADDVAGWSIVGCTQTDSSKSQVACLKFLSFDGRSTKLKVGGKPVVLDSFSGRTNGKPDDSGATANAGQRKLTSV